MNSLNNKQQFFSLIKPELDGRPELDLLYRGSRDGFRALEFHSKCDNQSDTITLFRTSLGQIFGGYTRAAWSSLGGYVEDPYAFLFCLNNGTDRPFLSKISDSSRAVYCGPRFGPTFGEKDIDVRESSDTFVGLAEFPFSFERPNECSATKNGGYYYFCAKRFQLNEIEVFRVAS